MKGVINKVKAGHPHDSLSGVEPVAHLIQMQGLKDTREFREEQKQNFY